MKFRKKPVVIEAVQWTGRNLNDILDLIGSGSTTPLVQVGDELGIDTLEGLMHVSLYDWVIKGVHGECYSCKPAIFAATYEPAE